MQKFTWKEKMRYAFDNTMAKGTGALIVWLFIFSIALIILISAFVIIVHAQGQTPEGADRSFLEVAWMSIMRTLDAGTMGGDTGSWTFLLSMFAVTLSGVFFISLLIGLLTNGIESKIESLRKGRSKVVEENHTIILGWSDQIYSIISELVIANENQVKPCVAILAEKDKVEMEDEIRDKVGDTKNTRVVCRTGNPIDMADLEIMGIENSKSIIVLRPESDDPDPEVVKAVLAITNHPKRRKEPYHIVAEIHDHKNAEVAKVVGKDEVEIILVCNLIARIIAQTCRQSGLSVVYQELMDFGGDEMYFHTEPTIVGKNFGESLFLYEDSAVIGLVPKGGSPVLNPPMDTRIKEGDQLIVIAEDDDTTKLSGLTDFGVNADAVIEAEPEPPEIERILILGWNWRTPTLINELNNYVPKGSIVLVVADNPDGHSEIEKYCQDTQNITLEFKEADTTDRRTLDSLSLEKYDHVVLMSYDGFKVAEADARTLFTLLHLRDIADKTGHKFSVVSEMLDPKNRTLADITRVDDFIVSDKLVSLMLAQVSENKALNSVFEDIFAPEGSEIYLKSCENYIKTGIPVNFYTILEATRRKNEVAIGYRQISASSNAELNYGIVTNPDKSGMITFAPGDKIIVFAES